MGTEGGGHLPGTMKTGMEGARVCSEEGRPGPLLQPFQSSLRMDAQGDCSLWASGQPSPDPGLVQRIRQSPAERSMWAQRPIF